MILEIADIRIAVGKNAEFEAALARAALTVVSHARGYLRHELHKGIESPERYLLMIWWNTLEDHTVGFRQGPLFPEWRAVVGPFFAAPPAVEHFTVD